ncbi:uncharacterized protein [Solanum tuberosum]|nr:PREDICTED: uncharacterized protein LOC102594170 isoform X3 [Solanum tuberosum]
MLLNEIPNDWLQQRVDAHCSTKRIPYVELISSVETFQDQILICDTGKIDIRLNVDIPEYVDLIEPLGESCIWRQTRGAAAEISEADSTITSSEKVGIAQQRYDEIEHLAFSTSEIEATIEERTMSCGDEIPEGKVEISCSVNSSPGTSEVFICAALYLRLKKDSDACSGGRQRKAARIADLLNPGTRASKDLVVQFLLASNRDLEEVIITRPVHVKLKFDCPKHPKADNSKDIIMTDTSVNVNVALK